MRSHLEGPGQCWPTSCHSLPCLRVYQPHSRVLAPSPPFLFPTESLSVFRWLLIHKRREGDCQGAWLKLTRAKVQRKPPRGVGSHRLWPCLFQPSAVCARLARSYLAQLGGRVPDAVQPILGLPLRGGSFEQPETEQPRGCECPGCSRPPAPPPGPSALQMEWEGGQAAQPHQGPCAQGRDHSPPSWRPEKQELSPPPHPTGTRGLGTHLSTSQDSVVLTKTELGRGTWKSTAAIGAGDHLQYHHPSACHPTWAQASWLSLAFS